MTYHSATLFADSARGIYIPQHFAESAQRGKFTGIDAEQWSILESGPEHEYYWDVWSEVLDNAETIDGQILHQDGDLWIVPAQAAIDAINEYCAESLEYEESHIDAGNNYAHMVAESWCDESTRRLVEQLRECDSVDSRWQLLDPDRLSDLAIECFDMIPRHMFDCTRGIVLDSYAIQEIEIEIEHIADPLVIDFVRESCEPYISGTNRAYLTSDVFWNAELNVARFNAAIEESANNG